MGGGSRGGRHGVPDGRPVKIPDYTKLGQGTPNRYTDSNIGYSWTGGSPAASGNNDRTGIRSVTSGTGFSFTLPADQSLRTFKLYAGGWDSTGELTAVLSDGSAAPYTIRVNHSEDGDTNTTYALTYQAAKPDQTLTVNWTMLDGGGECTLQAATLTAGKLAKGAVDYKALPGDSGGKKDKAKPKAMAKRPEPCPQLDSKARPLFDGKSLAGWEGEPKIWRVEDGVITGGSLTEFTDRNEFLASTQESGISSCTSKSKWSARKMEPMAECRSAPNGCRTAMKCRGVNATMATRPGGAVFTMKAAGTS